MAVAVQGSVVVGQDGKEVKWCFKCDSCGFVEHNVTHSWHDGGSNASLVSARRCHKCGNNQQIRIKGTS
jgi:hypothetical protein